MKSHRANVGGLRPDQFSFSKLFKAMHGPAEDTSDGERRSEQFGRQSQAMQQQCSVEFDVGIKSPLRLVFSEQAQRGGFDASGRDSATRSTRLATHALPC